MDNNNNNKKKITQLSQQILQKAIAAGIYNVIADQDYLNKINVFPVPDGDTGKFLKFYSPKPKKDNLSNTSLMHRE